MLQSIASLIITWKNTVYIYEPNTPTMSSSYISIVMRDIKHDRNINYTSTEVVNWEVMILPNTAKNKTISA
jgi:hypothetical protein